MLTIAELLQKILKLQNNTTKNSTSYQKLKILFQNELITLIKMHAETQKNNCLHVKSSIYTTKKNRFEEPLCHQHITSKKEENRNKLVVCICFQMRMRNMNYRELCCVGWILYICFCLYNSNLSCKFHSRLIKLLNN